MKKILKSRLFTFILGLVIAGTVGVYAYTVSSSNVSYDNSTSGLEADNVKDAIDDLYEKSKNTKAHITTIYSAASDTLYYYDDASNKVDFCTTNNNGMGLCAVPAKDSITVYSSVAKDPNNLSNPYQKTLNTTSLTDTIYLMPGDGDNTMYWYGYKSSNFGLDTSFSYPAYGWRSDGSYKYVNNMALSSMGTSWSGSRQLSSSITLSSKTTVKAIYNSTLIQRSGTFNGTVYALWWTYTYGSDNTSVKDHQVWGLDITNTKAARTGTALYSADINTASALTHYVNAIWFE